MPNEGTSDRGALFVGLCAMGSQLNQFFPSLLLPSQLSLLYLPPRPPPPLLSQRLPPLPPSPSLPLSAELRLVVLLSLPRLALSGTRPLTNPTAPKRPVSPPISALPKPQNPSQSSPPLNSILWMINSLHLKRFTLPSLLRTIVWILSPRLLLSCTVSPEIDKLIKSLFRHPK